MQMQPYGMMHAAAAGFLPSSISGLKLWLRADSITGLSDGEAIGTWPDDSGEGTDATQATASKKPLYKTAQINGLPIVRYDGTDDLLFNAFANWQAADTTGTVFIVFKPSNVTGFRALLSSDNEGGDGDHRWELGTLGNKMVLVFQDTGGVTDQIESTSTLSIGTTYLMMWAGTGSAWRMRLDGAEETIIVNLGTNSGKWLDDLPTTRDNITTGCIKRVTEAQFAFGDAGEFLYYDSLLSAARIGQVESQLATKWGITIP